MNINIAFAALAISLVDDAGIEVLNYKLDGANISIDPAGLMAAGEQIGKVLAEQAEAAGFDVGAAMANIASTTKQ